MSDALLRLYLDPAEIDQRDGYPHRWHTALWGEPELGEGYSLSAKMLEPRIPDYVRELAGHRCVRCRHPFVVGETPGEWSPCDEQCRHSGPARFRWDGPDWLPLETSFGFDIGKSMREGQLWEASVEAQWRVLTVHHLNGVKADCRWWNLASLCQRCHLTIQAKVWMDRPWNKPHSAWFQPYAAGWYAWRYLELELSREETMGRLEELLLLERTQEPLW
jgi:hypothetical protein